MLAGEGAGGINTQRTNYLRGTIVTGLLVCCKCCFAGFATVINSNNTTTRLVQVGTYNTITDRISSGREPPLCSQ